MTVSETIARGYSLMNIGRNRWLILHQGNGVASAYGIGAALALVGSMSYVQRVMGR